jgi:CheY-like chemotaxis protein/thiamine kinase-like enzyme
MSVYPNKGLAPRILIVDNDPRTRESLQALMVHWGYIPVIADGEGDSLIKDAKQKARDQRCHLALVDMRLIDDFDMNDRSGLDLVQELKPALSIVTSAYGDEEVASESLEEKGASAFVGKQRGPKVLKEKLEKVLLTVCAVKKDLYIEPLEVMHQITGTMFKGEDIQFSDQVADILSRLFPDARGLHIEKLGKDHESSYISTVPRPKSVILKVYERIGEDEMQPVLVKLARAEKIDKEVSRYKSFIRRQLVGLYTANLEDSTCAWDIGGAIYSYFGDAEVIPFSQFFQKEGIENIHRCLKHFFTTTWSAHYRKVKKVINTSLFDLYCQVWGTEWYERALSFCDLDMNLLLGQGQWKVVNTLNPIKWLKEHVVENNSNDLDQINKVFVAVTHGDLHGDNMLIDENNIAWVIDFERTGEGHVLQDFVELESDIIIRLNCLDENFLDFYQLCLAITKYEKIQPPMESEIAFIDKEIQKALLTVSIIRSLALEITNVSNFREYLFGLLFNSIFRATITPDKPLTENQKRALVLASIICRRLDHWDKPWPPEEWREI